MDFSLSLKEKSHPPCASGMRNYCLRMITQWLLINLQYRQFLNHYSTYLLVVWWGVTDSQLMQGARHKSIKKIVWINYCTSQNLSQLEMSGSDYRVKRYHQLEHQRLPKFVMKTKMLIYARANSVRFIKSQLSSLIVLLVLFSVYLSFQDCTCGYIMS